MIILNSCNNVKVQYTDSEPKKLFSMVALNKEDTPELTLFDDILVDEKTAVFLREFPFEWLDRRIRTRSMEYASMQIRKLVGNFL